MSQFCTNSDASCDTFQHTWYALLGTRVHELVNHNGIDVSLHAVFNRSYFGERGVIRATVSHNTKSCEVVMTKRGVSWTELATCSHSQMETPGLCQPSASSATFHAIVPTKGTHLRRAKGCCVRKTLICLKRNTVLGPPNIRKSRQAIKGALEAETKT